MTQDTNHSENTSADPSASKSPRSGTLVGWIIVACVPLLFAARLQNSANEELFAAQRSVARIQQQIDALNNKQLRATELSEQVSQAESKVKQLLRQLNRLQDFPKIDSVLPIVFAPNDLETWIYLPPGEHIMEVCASTHFGEEKGFDLNQYGQMPVTKSFSLKGERWFHFEIDVPLITSVDSELSIRLNSLGEPGQVVPLGLKRVLVAESNGFAQSIVAWPNQLPSGLERDNTQRNSRLSELSIQHQRRSYSDGEQTVHCSFRIRYNIPQSSSNQVRYRGDIQQLENAVLESYRFSQ